MRPNIVNMLMLLNILIASAGFAQSDSSFIPANIRDPLRAPQGYEKIEEGNQVLLDQLIVNAKIMGVVIDGNEKYVIINNSIVKEKEKWRELEIESIQKDHIVIIYQGEKVEIPYAGSKGDLK